MNAILAFVFILAQVAPAAKAPELTTRIDQARDAIAKQQYADAEATLTQVLVAANEMEDNVAAARAEFFLGRLKQEQAALATPDGAKVLRDESIQHYERSLRLYPKSGATMHNLAEVVAANGDYKRAKELLEDALRLDDPRRAIFAEKLGDIAAAAQKHKDAVEAYQIAAKSGEPSPALRQKLVREQQLDGDEPEDVLPHVWALAKTDRVDFALDAAMQALASEKLDDEEVDGYFGVLAYCLAHESLSPAELKEIGVLDALSKLKANNATKAKAESILALYDGSVADRTRFTTWPVKVNDDDVPSDLSPRNALNELAVSLGRRALYDGNYERAAPYYELAIDLGAGSDPRVLTDFATVRLRQKRFAEVEPLLEAFDASLESQDIASRPDAEAIYDYHRAIGTIYADLKQYANPKNERASALYHLQRSVEIASSSAENDVSDGLVKRLLGDAYAETGSIDKSTTARLDAAVTFKGNDDYASVRDMVGRIRPSSVDGSEQLSTYADVVDPLVQFSGEWPAGFKDEALVKGCLVVLATSQDPAARADAQKKLDELGIQVKGKTIGTIAQEKTKTSMHFAVRTRG